ncbi:hypothetical protein FRC11_003375, partial [Ceratobasidium sp. 423]
MTGSLTRITSPPFVYYVPSFDNSSDSDSEGWEEPEADPVVEGSIISRPSSSENFSAQICGVPQENEVIALNYTPQEGSPSSPSVSEYRVGFRDGNIRLL